MLPPPPTRVVPQKRTDSTQEKFLPTHRQTHLFGLDCWSKRLAVQVESLAMRTSMKCWQPATGRWVWWVETEQRTSESDGRVLSYTASSNMNEGHKVQSQRAGSKGQLWKDSSICMGVFRMLSSQCFQEGKESCPLLLWSSHVKQKPWQEHTGRYWK